MYQKVGVSVGSLVARSTYSSPQDFLVELKDSTYRPITAPTLIYTIIFFYLFCLGGETL